MVVYLVTSYAVFLAWITAPQFVATSANGAAMKMKAIDSEQRFQRGSARSEFAADLPPQLPQASQLNERCTQPHQFFSHLRDRVVTDASGAVPPSLPKPELDDSMLAASFNNESPPLSQHLQCIRG